MNSGPTTLRALAAQRLERPGWQLALLLLVCAIIYWMMLGSSSLASSEGHRVIPGWEMLERGDWYPGTLFGQGYLRKPPGMPWAVALSAAIFGESEWSARAVSALASTLSVLLAWFFGRRWFGTWGGLGAGLAQAICPVWWPPGRSAEIEALNDLGVALAVLPLVDLLTSVKGSVRLALAGSVGLVVAVLAKGPGVLPCVGAVVVAVCAIERSWRVLARPVLVPYVIPALAVLGAIGTAAWLHVKPEGAVTQSVTEFMWQEKRVLQILALTPLALASAIPASFAVLFPWGPDARGEKVNARSLRIAKTLAVACVLSLMVLTALGIDNPRYAWPALTMLMPLAGYATAGVYGFFTPKRRLIARVMTAGGPLAAFMILLIAGLVYVPMSERRRESISGRSAGELFAALVPDGAEIWADSAVEARPEVLEYARRAAGDAGKRVEIRWIRLADAPLPGADAPVTYLLLREDESDMERGRYDEAGLGDRLEAVGEMGRAHRFRFRLYRLSALAAAADDPA